LDLVFGLYVNKEKLALGYKSDLLNDFFKRVRLLHEEYSLYAINLPEQVLYLEILLVSPPTLKNLSFTAS
jgi:hypothetical protein